MITQLIYNQEVICIWGEHQICQWNCQSDVSSGQFLQYQPNKIKLVKSLSRANIYLLVIDFLLISFCSTDVRLNSFCSTFVPITDTLIVKNLPSSILTKRHIYRI